MLFGHLDLPTIIALLTTLVISLSFHEFAHAWSAMELGDDTARLNGRLTLNPLAHLDPIGSLLLIFVGFGWAKPVPVNPYNFRNPKLGIAIVSAAGPFANFLLALVAAIPVRIGLLNLLYGMAGGQALAQGLATVLYTFVVLNLNLMLFNLIPLGPLDGAKILRGLAPRDWDRWLIPLEQYGAFILLGLVFLGSFGGFSIFGMIISPASRFLSSAILGI
jgi:Zn-dependent protease